MVSGLRQTGMRAGTWAGRQAMVQVAAVAMGGSARATDMVRVHGVHGLSTELTCLHVGCFDGACVAAGGTVDSALMAPTFPEKQEQSQNQYVYKHSACAEQGGGGRLTSHRRDVGSKTPAEG